MHTYLYVCIHIKLLGLFYLYLYLCVIEIVKYTSYKFASMREKSKDFIMSQIYYTTFIY